MFRFFFCYSWNYWLDNKTEEGKKSFEQDSKTYSKQRTSISTYSEKKESCFMFLISREHIRIQLIDHTLRIKKKLCNNKNETISQSENKRRFT